MGLGESHAVGQAADGWKGETFMYDDEVRLVTKQLFDKADVFILTFGLSYSGMMN